VAQSLVQGAKTAGNRVSSMIATSGLKIGTATVHSVEGVTGLILRVARAVPIPDIPGIGRIRNAVFSLAENVVGAINRTLGSLQAFIERAVGSALDMIHGFVTAAEDGIIRVLNSVTSVLTRIVRVISSQFASLQSRIFGTV